MNKFIEVDRCLIKKTTVKRIICEDIEEKCYVTTDDGGKLIFDIKLYDKIREQLLQKDDIDILKELLCKIEDNVTESKKKAADPSYSEHDRNIYLGMAGAYADVGIYLRGNIPQGDTRSDTERGNGKGE